MNIEAFGRREKMLRLREKLIADEEGRLASKKGFTIDEVDDMMTNAIRESSDGQN